jgi:hypothetical protein
MLKKILKFFLPHKRKARVYPYIVFKPRFDTTTEVFSRTYFKNREKMLGNNPSPRVNITANIGLLTRITNWFIRDILIVGYKTWKRCSPYVKSMTGKPRLVQLLEMYLFAFTRPAMPETYYVFELYNRSYRRWFHFIHRYEMKNVNYKIAQKNFTRTWGKI